MKSIKEMWERLQEQLQERQKINRTVQELSKLSDYQLRDMGLHRSMINAVARGEYHG